MSDGVYEPVTDDENDGEVVDLDQVLGDDEVDETLDSGYSPPERARGLDAFGTTAQEGSRGESLDQRLAQEEPDPNLVADLGAAGPEWLADGEVGDARAGRLVDDGDGGSQRTANDLLAREVGIDAGAATAEEAAMHVIDLDPGDGELARDSRSRA
jgi:hypothetical protein